MKYLVLDSCHNGGMKNVVNDKATRSAPGT